MIKDIKYNGFSASPSDYDCLDGDLACSLGVIPEDGALRPVPPPSVLFKLNDGQRVVRVHSTASFVHYLVVDNSNRLYWRTKENDILTLIFDFAEKEILQIECMGNTILVLCKDGIHYILWKPSEGAYTYLGNKIPECPISFGLQGSPVKSDDFTITYSATTNLWRDFSKENIASITEQVLAQVNAFVADNSTNKGRFMFPFFVRYAYRLFDGSLSHHSAPILMLPTTTVNPVVPVTGGNYPTETSATLRVFAVTTDLDYQTLISEEERNELAKWSDIVKSVDVFISAPIYTYNQGGEVKHFNQEPKDGAFYGKYDRDDSYGITRISKCYNLHTGDSVAASICLPEKSEKDFYSDIADCSQFYFLTSFNIEDLSLTREKISIPDNYLQALVNREVMSDDYQTHDTLCPSMMYIYNSRLNIANIERRLFSGYHTASMVCYIDKVDSATTGKTEIFTTIDTQNGRFETRNTPTSMLAQDSRVFTYLFYPDVAAKRMKVRPYGLDGTLPGEGELAGGKFVAYKEAPLKPHAFLNGAVYFNGFPQEQNWSSPFVGGREEQPIELLPNKIYTSDVNNPFRFPVLGINNIGASRVVGLSTAAKALSEGQFGQFPLYAFTSEGVWAMEVSNTGTYTARQPITRDTCLSAESITPIDDAVLFITVRGVMLLSGANSICISDILDAPEQHSVLSLPYISELINKEGLDESTLGVIPFKEYIRDARMIYDYVNQRIVLYNSTLLYAYVYSLKSKSWGLISSNIVYGVNSYPNALAMTSDASLVDLSQASAIDGVKGLVMSRPIKLDFPNDLKTVDSVIQRGFFKKGNVKSLLYGSRDLFNWHLVASSKDHYLRGFSGTPYKYFRVGVVCDLSAEESVSGCSIQFKLKQTNQPR